jgi:hypothetical protein
VDQVHSTVNRRCLPTLAGEDKEDKVVPEVGSLEHKRWWRGSAMVAEDSCCAGSRVREGARE